MPLAEKLDPVDLSLANAPVDDEPTTEGDLAAIAEANEAVRRGDVLTTAELMRELGL